MALRFVKAIRCGGDMFARCISVGFHGNQQHFAREPPCQMVSLILGVEYRWVSPSCVVTSATSTKKKYIYVYFFFGGGVLSFFFTYFTRQTFKRGRNENKRLWPGFWSRLRTYFSSFLFLCVCVCVCCYFVIPPPFSYFLSSSLAFSVVLSSQAANENSASEPLHLAKHHTEPHATTR